MQPDHRRPAPFRSAEAAWFWTARALRDACGPEPSRRGPVPYRVEEVVKCLDSLYRRRRIELLHARILRIWGFRGLAPNPARTRERSDWRIWQEALERLEGPLRARGIVASIEAGPVLQDAAD